MASVGSCRSTQLDSTTEEIVQELKSRGSFDTFRRECLADVDTRPAYQNLRQRVEGTVTSFLGKQLWAPTTNRNQLREKLRRYLADSRFLEVGVDRIVDQVVDRNIYTNYLPSINALVKDILKISNDNVERVDEDMELTDMVDSAEQPLTSSFGTWANQFHIPLPEQQPPVASDSSMSISTESDPEPSLLPSRVDVSTVALADLSSVPLPDEEHVSKNVGAASDDDETATPDVRSQMSPLSEDGCRGMKNFLSVGYKLDSSEANMDLRGMMNRAVCMDPVIDDLIKSELDGEPSHRRSSRDNLSAQLPPAASFSASKQHSTERRRSSGSRKSPSVPSTHRDHCNPSDGRPAAHSSDKGSTRRKSIKQLASPPRSLGDNDHMSTLADIPLPEGSEGSSFISFQHQHHRESGGSMERDPVEFPNSGRNSDRRRHSSSMMRQSQYQKQYTRETNTSRRGPRRLSENRISPRSQSPLSPLPCHSADFNRFSPLRSSQLERSFHSSLSSDELSPRFSRTSPDNISTGPRSSNRRRSISPVHSYSSSRSYSDKRNFMSPYHRSPSPSRSRNRHSRRPCSFSPPPLPITHHSSSSLSSRSVSPSYNAVSNEDHMPVHPNSFSRQGAVCRDRYFRRNSSGDTPRDRLDDRHARFADAEGRYSTDSRVRESHGGKAHKRRERYWQPHRREADRHRHLAAHLDNSDSSESAFSQKSMDRRNFSPRGYAISPPPLSEGSSSERQWKSSYIRRVRSDSDRRSVMTSERRAVSPLPPHPLLSSGDDNDDPDRRNSENHRRRWRRRDWHKNDNANDNWRHRRRSANMHQSDGPPSRYMYTGVEDANLPQSPPPLLPLAYSRRHGRGNAIPHWRSRPGNYFNRRIPPDRRRRHRRYDYSGEGHSSAMDQRHA